MSAKFLHVFTDENPELKRQNGCMNGIFQIFDRQHLLTGKRLNGNSHKKHHPSGHAHTNSASPRAKHGAGSPRIVLEKVYSKSSSENQRASMESSRTSFSSASCSSFSSLECSKASQQEASSFERTKFPDRSSKNPLNAPAQKGRRSLDFRDVVKDSIDRDSHHLSVKTSSKEGVKTRILKHIDSPRPMQLSKSKDGSYIIGINGKSREPSDFNESIQVLGKLKARWNLSEFGESPRSSFEVAKAHPLDPSKSREVHRFSFDSKLSSKHPELPRLSMDSREGSLRNSKFESKLNLIFNDLDRSNSSNSNRRISNISKSNTVIAKLMGLESLPNYSREDCDRSKSLKTAQDNKQDFPSPSPRNSIKTSTSPRMKDLDSVKTPISNSKVPVETALWRQQEKQHVQSKTKLKKQSESVYSEIETRLSELEFRKSNKDLRAVKQLLDAMQAKGFMETKKTDLKNQKIIPLRNFESPIVIMKPAKSVKRSGGAATSSVTYLESLSGMKRKPHNHNVIDKKAVKNHTSGKKTSERTEDKPRSRLPRENGGSSLKTSGSLSPRLQLKRIEAERSRSTLPSLDSSKPQKASANRKPLESVSPRGELRQKPTQVRDRDEQLGERSERRDFSYQGDDISQRSDSNISLVSQLDTIIKQKKSAVSLSEEVSAAEFITAVREQEQPSPVSVLDASFYQDDLPSPPLMKRLNPLKGCCADEENQTSDDSWTPSGLLKILTQNSISEINQKKLLGIDNLNQNLKALISTDDGLSTTNHISSLSETENPDHRYVSEILLASGLLSKDLNSFAVSPINHDLFFALQKTKTSSLTKPEIETDQEKIHRKLIFDVVNEVLIEKLELTSSGPYSKLSRGFPSGQKLLKELCLEIDRLQVQTGKCGSSDDNDDEMKISDEEVLRVSKEWTDFGKEDSGVVLDIERLIFKDLIDEIVSGEAVLASQAKSSSRWQRQVLISKVSS